MQQTPELGNRGKLLRVGVREILVGFVSAILATALIALYVHKTHGGVSALVCVGQDHFGQPPLQAVTSAVGQVGYDGQFYYIIALDPFLRRPPLLDLPARQLRILYPLLCYLVSWGNPRVLLYAMPAINVLAIGAMGGIGAWLARRHGMNAWWGLAAPIGSNAILAVTRDLTDPMGATTVLAFVVICSLPGPVWAIALSAALALLAREQNAAIVGVACLVGAVRGNRALTWGSFAGLLLWGSFFLYLRSATGVWPMLPAGGNFSWPFVGIAHYFTNSVPGARGMMTDRAMLLNLLSVVVGVWLAVKAKAWAARLMIAAGAALVIFAGPMIYADFYSFARVFYWLPLGIFMASVETRRKWSLFFLWLNLLSPVVAILRAPHVSSL